MSAIDHGAAFSAYATNVAFRISLTRAMALTLWTVNEVEAGRMSTYTVPGTRQAVAGGVPDHFIASLRCLSDRGLVIFEDPASMRPKGCRQSHRLTNAGRHVMALCAIAKLIPAAKPANDRAIPKRNRA